MDQNTYTIKELSSDKNYWFVRTNQGEYYADFALNGYIAIGWDAITDLSVFTIDNQSSENLKDSIKNLVSTSYEDESRPGLSAGQMIRFINEMKIGDIVIIPDAGAHSISIGIIESDAYIYQQPTDDSDDDDDENIGYKLCPFLKRRNIRWMTSATKNRIDPHLFKLFCAVHTISDANNYSRYIDRMMYPIYMRDGQIHITLNVEQEESITARSMNNLISGILALIDDHTTPEISKKADALALKVIVESPGKMEFIGPAIVGCAVCSSLALFLFGADINFKAGEYSFTASSQGLSGAINTYTAEEHRHEEAMKALNSENNVEALKKALADMKVQLPAPIKGNQ